MAEDIELLRLRAMAKAKAAQAVEQIPDQSLGEQALGAGATTIKALGVPGAIVRGGIASALGLSKPEDELMNAPTTSDYLNRAGVSEGASLSDLQNLPFVPNIYAEKGLGSGLRPEKGGMLDPSVRGVAGFVGDVALDPVTYLSGGLSAVAKGTTQGGKLLKALQLANASGGLTRAGKVTNVVLNPAEILARKGGTAAYKGAFSKIDQNAEKMGKEMLPSQFAEQTGFSGSGKDLVEKMKEYNANQGMEIGNVLNKASEKGAKVDIYGDLFNKYANKAAELKSVGTPESSNVADQILARGQELMEARGARPSVSAANESKTAMNKYNKYGLASDVDTVAQEARKEIATPLSGAIKESVRNTDPELYARLAEANQKYSSTSPKVQDMINQWATLPTQTKHPLSFSKVDYGLLGASATGNPTAVGILAAKKAGDVLSSTQGRTAIGKKLVQVGKNANGMLDATLRQALEHKLNKEKK